LRTRKLRLKPRTLSLKLCLMLFTLRLKRSFSFAALPLEHGLALPAVLQLRLELHQPSARYTSLVAPLLRLPSRRHW